MLLAELQRDPNASPPPLPAGLDVGLLRGAADMDDVYEDVVPVIGIEAVDDGVGWGVVDIGTEVK